MRGYYPKKINKRDAVREKQTYFMLNGRYQRKDNCLVEQWMKFLIFFIPEYFFICL